AWLKWGARRTQATERMMTGTQAASTQGARSGATPRVREEHPCRGQLSIPTNSGTTGSNYSPNPIAHVRSLHRANASSDVARLDILNRVRLDGARRSLSLRSSPSKRRFGMASREVLVADIGGTNARFSVADQDTLQLRYFATYRCAEFPSLTEVARKYLSGLPKPPKLAAVAVAGPTGGEVVQLTNSTWKFRVSELRAALGLHELLVLNDFEALAYALPCLEASDLHQLGGTEPLEHAAKAVLGPGTGLGVAGLAWSPSGWLAVPSEGGHSTFAAKDARELAMVERLIAGRGHLSVERVVSGPGIVDVYR